MDFATLKKNSKKDFSGHKVIKIAILGDSPTQFLALSFKGYGYEVGVNFDIFEAEFDQIDRQILDTTSEYYQFQPEFTIIFHSSPKLLKHFYKLGTKGKEHFAEDWIDKIRELQEAVQSNCPNKVIYFNFCEINDRVFGNFSNKISVSFTYQLRKLNYELMNLAQESSDFYISDLSTLQNEHGIHVVTDPKIYVMAEMIFSIDFVPYVAKNTVDIILAITGSFKKCLILDLDNTLWGGIIGDDGTEKIQLGELGIGKAFTDFQLWVKQLQLRGIILAVCSKNDEIIAKEPFDQHPDMVLSLADIAVFTANWDNKADNIRDIQEVLNIGFDSMVFVDDSPFERNIVRANIPEITVPEMPEDPAEYTRYLWSLNLFETASFTEGDTKRTKQYQQEAKRSVKKKSFTNEADFLKSLSMESEVKKFDKFSIPRVAQLTQRSNQFNLRTVRYTQEMIEKIAYSENYIPLSFTLKDKFGDNGLISVVILENKNDALFIDTWIMSCRVLKRGVENFVLNEVVNKAKEAGLHKIVGEYLPTQKNGMVKTLLPDLGFKSVEDLWVLDLKKYNSQENFVKRR